MKKKRNFKENFIGSRRLKLFKRDPLAIKMEKLRDESLSDTLSESEKSKLSNCVEELAIELSKKWNCHLMPKRPIPFKPFSWFKFVSGAFTVADATEYIKKLSAKIKKDLKTRSQSRNHFERTGWIFYYLDGGYDDRGNIYIPIPPISVPIIVDIGGLTVKDKAKVTEEIWNIIKSKIKERRAKTKGQWKGIPAVRDSEELGFITSKTIDDKVFKKYLKWYDLHMKEGLSFRKIALYEILEKKRPKEAEQYKRKLEEKTKTVKIGRHKEITLKGFIGEPIKGEDNVEKKVKLIYQAIHRKPYPSTPKKKQERFNCPEHGNGCPKNCSYLNQYEKDFNRQYKLKPLYTTDPSDLDNLIRLK